MDKSNRFFEGCGKEGPIRCIFLCEFHPTAGPKITCQVPEDYISKDVFEAVSVYLIPKPQLLQSTLTINACGIKIIGFPTRIDNKKYARNAFQFNVCFICDSWARTVQYESVVKKLIDFLTVLEIESSFLSNQEENRTLTERLVHIFTKVLDDINKNNVCTLTEGSASTHLKVVKVRPDPLPVLDNQVPVFIEGADHYQAEHWDLTTQQVLPFIDGINHVAKIAVLADVENNLVKTCLQNLVYYFVVKMVPIFQYSNTYTATPKLRQLAIDKKLQGDCLCFVAKSAWQLPNFRDVFKLYCSMTHGTTVRDLCNRYNPSALKVDERKLVQFGCVQGLIRKINKYPITVAESEDYMNSKFSGLLSTDEICCSIGITSSQLEATIESDPNIIVISK